MKRNKVISVEAPSLFDKDHELVLYFPKMGEIAWTHNSVMLRDYNNGNFHMVITFAERILEMDRTLSPGSKISNDFTTFILAKSYQFTGQNDKAVVLFKELNRSDTELASFFMFNYKIVVGGFGKKEYKAIRKEVRQRAVKMEKKAVRETPVIPRRPVIAVSLRIEDKSQSVDIPVKANPLIDHEWVKGIASLYNREHYTNAIIMAEKALSFSPENGWAHLFLANIYFIGGDSKKSAEHFDAAYKIDKSFSLLYQKRGPIRVPHIDRAFLKGRAFLTRVFDVPLRPNRFDNWHIPNEAESKLTVRDYEYVLAVTQVVEDNPENYQAWFYRGLAFLGLNKLPEAIEALQKANELKPNNEPFMKSLAEAKQKLAEQ
jgi:tetratricopeptide (TPR) repeat protein